MRNFRAVVIESPLAGSIYLWAGMAEMKSIPKSLREESIDRCEAIFEIAGHLMTEDDQELGAKFLGFDDTKLNFRRYRLEQGPVTVDYGANEFEVAMYHAVFEGSLLGYRSNFLWRSNISSNLMGRPR